MREISKEKGRGGFTFVWGKKSNLGISGRSKKFEFGVIQKHVPGGIESAISIRP
jgi:hypothetical protein